MSAPLPDTSSTPDTHRALPAMPTLPTSVDVRTPFVPWALTVRATPTLTNTQVTTNTLRMDELLLASRAPPREAASSTLKASRVPAVSGSVASADGSSYY